SGTQCASSDLNTSGAISHSMFQVAILSVRGSVDGVPAVAQAPISKNEKYERNDVRARLAVRRRGEAFRSLVISTNAEQAIGLVLDDDPPLSAPLEAAPLWSLRRLLGRFRWPVREVFRNERDFRSRRSRIVIHSSAPRVSIPRKHVNCRK